MLEFGYNCFHMRPNLFRRPIFICHMLNAEINKLFFAGIFEFAVAIAPFAVLLVKRTVCFFADYGIFKRHSAALTDKLPRRAQQRIYRNIKKFRQ